MNNTETILEHSREAEGLLKAEINEMFDWAPRRRFSDAVQSVNSAKTFLSPDCTKHIGDSFHGFHNDTLQLE